MRDRFPGFYRPSDEESGTFFDEGLVCPDANVLLTLYKVSESTREDVLSVFRELGDRLWLPHQVVLEFQRGRQAAIREQEEVYDQLEKELQSFPGRLTDKVRRHHPRIDREELEKVANSAMGNIKEHLSSLHEAHPNPLASDDVLGADVVRDQLEKIVGDRIGAAADPAEVERAGKLRYPKRVPPGYADTGKDEGRQYGDLAVWLELLDEAAKRKIPVLFVTEDAKEDWWIRDGSGTIGPRPELVQEMHDKAKSRFWMYRFEPFLVHAAKHFDIELGVTSSAEVTDAQETQLADVPSWAWNHPFPLPSGSVAGFHTPSSSQGRFLFSPGNPFAPNLGRQGHQNQFQWQLPTPGEVEVEENAVRLGLDGAIVTEGSLVMCSVTDPGGQTTNTTVVASGDSIGVVFPSDFIGANALSAGAYGYTWSELIVPDSSVWVTVARGSFAV